MFKSKWVWIFFLAFFDMVLCKYIDGIEFRDPSLFVLRLILVGITISFFSFSMSIFSKIHSGRYLIAQILEQTSVTVLLYLLIERAVRILLFGTFAWFHQEIVFAIFVGIMSVLWLGFCFRRIAGLSFAASMLRSGALIVVCLICFLFVKWGIFSHGSRFQMETNITYPFLVPADEDSNTEKVLHHIEKDVMELDYSNMDN